MYFDTSQLDQRRCYKLLASTVTPRPIAWVITKSPQGALNAAPFSFFNFFSGFPPVVCIGIGFHEGRPKDTLANLRATDEFVINLVSEDLAEAMNTTATPFPPGVSELDKARLSTNPGIRVDVPRIARSPVALECKARQFLEVDTTAVIVVSHVIGVHVMDEAVIDAQRCYIDAAKLRLIGRMESPGWYTRTHDRFKLKQLTAEAWEREHAQDQDAKLSP